MPNLKRYYDSQIWLNYVMDDCHFQYIIKMKKNIVGPWFPLFFFQCFDVKSLMNFGQNISWIYTKNLKNSNFLVTKATKFVQKEKSSQGQ
jgi:hypothetical protein